MNPTANPQQDTSRSDTALGTNPAAGAPTAPSATTTSLAMMPPAAGVPPTAASQAAPAAMMMVPHHQQQQPANFTIDTTSASKTTAHPVRTRISPTDVAAFHRQQLAAATAAGVFPPASSPAGAALPPGVPHGSSAFHFPPGNDGRIPHVMLGGGGGGAPMLGMSPVQPGGAAASGGGGVSYVKEEEDEEQHIDPDQLKAILDRMWEEQVGEKLKGVKKIRMSKKLTTKLLQHQVDGIRWLHHMETSTTTALPMYNVREYPNGTKRFVSKITGRFHKSVPKPVNGAVLADAMGCGKTLQTLGLMLSNPPAANAAATATLIVCPVSVVSNWVQQIEAHVKPNTFRVGIYMGSKTKRSQLLTKVHNGDLDVLLVSYETLRSDYVDSQAKKKEEKQEAVATATDATATTPVTEDDTPKKKKVRMEETLMNVAFHRVVLDEAHAIRNSHTSAYHAAKHLKATFKLALTGTPFVNSPDDTFALLTFLGVDSISDAAVFREKITKPIKAGKGVGLSRLRCALAQVTLRRTKQTTDIQLVAREKKLVKINFPEGSHKQVHDALFTSSKAVFDALGKGDAEKMTFKTHGKMFEQLLRIRQACCSGELVPIDRRNSALQVARHLKLKGNSGPLDSTSANAILERLTGDAAVDPGAATTAPMGTPPKVEAMLKLIGDMAPDEKGVVFSQFVSFLDIIQHHLEANGHSTTRLTGSMNAKQRIESMELFEKQDTTKARFVLCQIKAAGQGINLDRANVVFMMDPWFNQAVLEQAMDRVHRLSQTRPVRVYSLVMAHTIEDRLLTVAKRKEMMGKGTLMKLTEEEERHAKMTQMRDLFDVEDEEEGEEISV